MAGQRRRRHLHQQHGGAAGPADPRHRLHRAVRGVRRHRRPGLLAVPGNFAADPAVAAALQAAGHFSFSPVLATSAPIETFSCSSAPTATCTNAATHDLKYAIRVAALDTTNDRKVNYDTLVFFDTTRGITAGPFHAPSTGPAYARFGGENAPFFFEGSGAKVGAAYFVSGAGARSFGRALRPLRCQLHPAQRAGAGRRRRHQQQHRVLASAG